MAHIPEIDIEEAKEQLATGETIFVDIRDTESFNEGRIPGAKHLHNGNVAAFMQETDKTTPIVVYCYHGNSSLSATAFLLEQGFADVKSMSGGFETWRLVHPQDVVQTD